MPGGRVVLVEGRLRCDEGRSCRPNLGTVGGRPTTGALAGPGGLPEEGALAAPTQPSPCSPVVAPPSEKTSRAALLCLASSPLLSAAASAGVSGGETGGACHLAAQVPLRDLGTASAARRSARKRRLPHALRLNGACLSDAGGVPDGDSGRGSIPSCPNAGGLKLGRRRKSRNSRLEASDSVVTTSTRTGTLRRPPSLQETYRTGKLLADEVAVLAVVAPPPRAQVPQLPLLGECSGRFTSRCHLCSGG